MTGKTNSKSRKLELIKFARAKFETLSNVEAARAAGREGAYDALERWGGRALNTPEVQKELARLDLKASEDVIASRREACRILTDQLRGSMADFLVIDEKGNAGIDLKRAKEAGKLHLLQQIEFDEAVTVEDSDGKKRVIVPVKRIKLKDEQGAATLLGKMLGWNAPERKKLEIEKIHEKANWESMTPEERKAILKELESECNANHP